MTEGVYFRNLNGKEAEELLELTKHIGGSNDFEYSVSCIGVPTCQIGIAESQAALSEVLSYVKEKFLIRIYYLNYIFQDVETLVGFTKLVK